jgi:hypothetical protein
MPKIVGVPNETTKRRWPLVLVILVLCDSFGIYIRQLPESYVSLHPWINAAGNAAFIFGTLAAIVIILTLLSSGGKN